MFSLQQNARGNWRHWNDFIKGSTVPITSKISEILVPTMDTVRYTYLMDLCITYTKYVEKIRVVDLHVFLNFHGKVAHICACCEF